MPAFLRAALICAFAILWVGGVVSHFLSRSTPPGAGWTAPAFLICAALSVLVDLEQGRLRLLALGALGWLAELAGTRLGVPFGAYSYGPALQPQALGVPLVMACAWIILLAYVKSCLSLARLKPWQAIVAGAVWMTALDLVIDPVATAALRFWRWHVSGAYYGIPLSNFAGWLIVSALLLTAGMRLDIKGRITRWMGTSVVIFFGLLAAAHRLLGPAAISAALSLVHLELERRRSRSTCA